MDKKIKLTELKKIIKNILNEMDFSDEVKMMVAKFNETPNPVVNHILANFEKISNLVGSGTVKFLRPTKQAYKDKGIDLKGTLFLPPIAIYLDLGDPKDETILYDLENNEYIFESWGKFYLDWRGGGNTEEI